MISNDDYRYINLYLEVITYQYVIKTDNIKLYFNIDFCGDPPQVIHAQSNLMQNQKHYVFKIGEIATYSCAQGYYRISGMDQIQCRSHDEHKQPQWDSDTLKCESKSNFCFCDVYNFQKAYISSHIHTRY
jgi:hypothetical protein